MKPSVLDLRSNRLRSRVPRVRQQLGPWQRSIEHKALALRAELGLADIEPLDQQRALATIENCEIWPLKNLPELGFEHLMHFRNAGRHIGAFAVKDESGDIDIIFNDEHSPADVRVHLLEELFHIRLQHPFDTLRLYSDSRVSRTYDEAKEDEAYGCGVASLLPYYGLEAMLARGEHIARIAEHFTVPIPVVEFRIAATRLGDLAAAPARQLSLLAGFA